MAYTVNINFEGAHSCFSLQTRSPPGMQPSFVEEIGLMYNYLAKSTIKCGNIALLSLQVEIRQHCPADSIGM